MQFPYLDRISYTSKKANPATSLQRQVDWTHPDFGQRGIRKQKGALKKKKKKAYSHHCAAQLFHAKEVEKRNKRKGKKNHVRRKKKKKDNVNAQTPSLIPFRKPFIPETIKKE